MEMVDVEQLIRENERLKQENEIMREFLRKKSRMLSAKYTPPIWMMAMSSLQGFEVIECSQKLLPCLKTSA